MLVLYVEDDPRLRIMTAECLALRGLDVVTHERCDAAAAWLRTTATAPDALVTDVETPGTLDGWSLAEIARGLHGHLPVIYTTGCEPPPGRCVAGSVLLRKPFQVRALVAALAQGGHGGIPVDEGQPLVGFG
jgi:CheY-like chemotaxis protein